MRAVKPTREQKKIIVENKLDWHNWLVTGEDNNTLILINKTSGRKRAILK